MLSEDTHLLIPSDYSLKKPTTKKTQTSEIYMQKKRSEKIFQGIKLRMSFGG